MLKFAVMFLCVLCYPHQILSPPVIKGSGVQWTEPKGKGKGNLTLIMIPQNNSCGNDSDLLIAVKSDYQVVSQDTQLLNLVINEYLNDTLKESKCNKNENQINEKMLSNSDPIGNQKKVNQENAFDANSNNIGVVSQAKLTDENTQYNQINSPKLIGNGDLVPIKLSEFTVLNRKDFLKPGESHDGGYSYKSDINYEFDKQNNTEGGSLMGFDNAIDEFNGNGSAVKDNQNSKNSETLSHTDLIKYLNSVGDMEHSNLKSVKSPNNVKFYEAEKKTPVRVNEQGKEYPTARGNAEDVFKFLSAVQIRETTAAITKNAFDIFNFLRATESSQVTPPSKRGFSIPYNYSEENSVNVSDTINSKNSNAQLFNDNEIKIFKLLNISEPNVGNKLKKMNEKTANIESSNEDSDKNLLKEVANIISKLNQDPIKKEHNLRSDSLMGNPAEDLVALEGGDSDSKVKLLKGDFLAPTYEEESLKKQWNSLKSNKNGEFKAGGDSSNTEGVLTTCYVVTAVTIQQESSLLTTASTSLGTLENTAVVHSEAGITTPTASPTKDDEKENTVDSSLPSTTAISPTDNNERASAVDNQADKVHQTTHVIPLGDKESTPSSTCNEGGVTSSIVGGKNINTQSDKNAQVTSGTPLAEAQVTNLLPSATTPSLNQVSASPNCRTSIIYICSDSPTVTGSNEQTSEKLEEKLVEIAKNLKTDQTALIKDPIKKITAAPQKDCSSLIDKRKESSCSVNNEPIIPAVQYAQLNEKSLFPNLESSMLLANNKLRAKGKNDPILLNTPLSGDTTDVILSDSNEKLAKFIANPSDLAVNEEVLEDISPKNGRTRGVKKKKVISIKNSNLIENEQVIRPGQILKMRLAGKKIIVNQMPSYRLEHSETNCNSTQPTINGMEADVAEIDVGSGTNKKGETECTDSALSGTSTKTKSEDGKKSQTENIVSESNTKSTTERKIKGDRYSSQISTATQIVEMSDKPKTGTNLLEKVTTRQPKTGTQTLMVVSQGEKISKLNTGSGCLTTKNAGVSTSLQKMGKGKSENEQIIKVPEECVKEIIIKIIRETMKPEKYKSKTNDETGNVNCKVDDKSLQKNKFKQPTHENIKPGGYEMDTCNLEKNRQQNIKYWYPNQQENKNLIDSIDKNDEYPYSSRNNFLSNSFYIGKSSDEDVVPVIHDDVSVTKAIFKERNGEENVLLYKGLKLLKDSKNSIKNT